MAKELVSLTALQDFLNVNDEGEAAVLKTLLAEVKAFFEQQVDRARAPFADTQTGRVEVHDGTGSALLTVDYPIAALTSITLGHNPASPIETLTVNDPSLLVFATGDRTIERVDGGTFGEYRKPRYIHVTYNAEADLPVDVAIAVKRLTAQLYRQRGSEDAQTEAVSGYSRTMADLATTDPIWRQTVQRHARGVFL